MLINGSIQLTEEEADLARTIISDARQDRDKCYRQYRELVRLMSDEGKSLLDAVLCSKETREITKERLLEMDESEGEIEAEFLFDLIEVGAATHFPMPFILDDNCMVFSDMELEHIDTFLESISYVTYDYTYTGVDFDEDGDLVSEPDEDILARMQRYSTGHSLSLKILSLVISSGNEG